VGSVRSLSCDWQEDVVGGGLIFPQIEQPFDRSAEGTDMEAKMKINGEVVRVLREQKSWSQEHLATASGLSVRTVQRVEVEGVASAETRLALAAALDVPVAELIPVRPTTEVAASNRSLPPSVASWRFWPVGGTPMRKTLIGLGVGVALAFALLILASALHGWIPQS
jgi:DNA-binding XRE family transcriptional regulator